MVLSRNNRFLWSCDVQAYAGPGPISRRVYPEAVSFGPGGSIGLVALGGGTGDGVGLMHVPLTNVEFVGHSDRSTVILLITVLALSLRIL